MSKLNLDSALLREVRSALLRMEDGTLRHLPSLREGDCAETSCSSTVGRVLRRLAGSGHRGEFEDAKLALEGE